MRKYKWCIVVPVLNVLALSTYSATQSTGFTFQEYYDLKGNSLDGRFGAAVSGAGDVNNDGFDDVIVGAHEAAFVDIDQSLESNAGRAYVYSGRDGSILYTFEGTSQHQNVGYSLDGGWDINGDDHPDMLIGGNPTRTNVQNASRAYRGQDAAVLFTPPSEVRFTELFSGAGDVNGDGFDDLMLSNKYQQSTDYRSGKVWIYSGKTSQLLYSFNGAAAEELFGASISAAGDVNNDGYDDVVVGATMSGNIGDNRPGYAKVFSGHDGALLLTLSGSTAFDRFGTSVSSAGDVNKDGYDDVIVGASYGQKNGVRVGSAQVFSGADGSILHTFYGDAEFDGFGVSVDGAGDLNGDGYADLVVGASGADINGTNSGMARVFSGKDGSVLASLYGKGELDSFGLAVSGAGDVNNDGLDDIIIGAPRDGATVYISVPEPATIAVMGLGCLGFLRRRR